MTPNEREFKELAKETMERIESFKHWFETMDRIHWNFGLPYQWQPLADTLESEVIE